MHKKTKLGTIIHCVSTCLLLLLCAPAFGTGEYQQVFEDPADFPLMGDWLGEWINPHRLSEKHNPELAAQLICLKKNRYRVMILQKLNLRAVPYLDVTADVIDGRIVIDQNGWKCTFDASGVCKGVAHDGTDFELKKTQRLSPTLGLKPPTGAKVLFDGSGFDAWRHYDDRKVSWLLLEDGAMQSVSAVWNDNKKNGLGGDLITREKFGSLKYHMEFRYAVEPGKSGQFRGNSGLFFHGIGEIQILNNYGTGGFWDECGAIYKIAPPKVNAAAVPLQWQTYDVEIILPEKVDEKSTALVTAYLNGQAIHHKTPVPYKRHDGAVEIGLQDHMNALQFRNIWVSEL